MNNERIISEVIFSNPLKIEYFGNFLACVESQISLERLYNIIFISADNDETFFDDRRVLDETIFRYWIHINVDQYRMWNTREILRQKRAFPRNVIRLCNIRARTCILNPKDGNAIFPKITAPKCTLFSPNILRKEPRVCHIVKAKVVTELFIWQSLKLQREMARIDPVAGGN